MKLKLERRILKKLSDFFSISTIILAIIVLFNVDNLLLRIYMQGSFTLMMLFKGMHTISDPKEKNKSGYIFIAGAIFLFFIMISIVFIGFKSGDL